MAQDLCTASNSLVRDTHHCPHAKLLLAEGVVTVTILLMLFIVLRPNYLHQLLSGARTAESMAVFHTAHTHP